MSVNGEHEVKDGDVFLEKDGYLKLHISNVHGVWYSVALSPNNNMWVAEPKTKATVHDDDKFVMNIKELLVSVRKEVQDELSS